MVVLGERHPLRSEYQSVAAITISLRKGPVNRHGVAAALDRFFPLFNFDRDMAVDDQAALLDAEFSGDTAAEIGVMNEVEIGIFVLLFRFFVLDEVAFEGRHP